MSEKESELIQHLSAGDKFQVLVTKAGGMPARYEYVEWMQVALNLAMQTELFAAVQIRQLEKHVKLLETEIEQLKAKETPAGTETITPADSKPSEGSGSAVAKLLQKQRETGDKSK